MTNQPTATGLRGRMVAVLIVVALAASACATGAQSSPEPPAPTVPGIEESAAVDELPTSTVPMDPEEAMLAFSDCMAEHGVELPSGDDGDSTIAFGDVENDDDLEAAFTDCDPILENAFGEFELDPEQAAEFADRELAFARCMRENGVPDWPDPTGDMTGSISIEIDGDPASLDSAFDACSDHFDLEDGGAELVTP